MTDRYSRYFHSQQLLPDPNCRLSAEAKYHIHSALYDFLDRLGRYSLYLTSEAFLAPETKVQRYHTTRYPSHKNGAPNEDKKLPNFNSDVPYIFQQMRMKTKTKNNSKIGLNHRRKNQSQTKTKQGSRPRVVRGDTIVAALFVLTDSSLGMVEYVNRGVFLNGFDESNNFAQDGKVVRRTFENRNQSVMPAARIVQDTGLSGQASVSKSARSALSHAADYFVKYLLSAGYQNARRRRSTEINGPDIQEAFEGLQ